MDQKTIETRIKKAIKVRETGNLNLSRTLFELLIIDIKKVLHKNSTDEQKNIFITLMGEYVIQQRHEAKKFYYSALEVSKELLEFDIKNKIGNPLSIRSVSNTLINLGNYEEAEEYFRKLLPFYLKNSAKLGDTRSHLGYCLYRQGKVKEGQILINQAIKEIEKNTAHEAHLAVWYSRALMFRARIKMSQCKYKDAFSDAEQALKLAKNGKYTIRIKQAEEIVEYLKNKVN